MKVHNLTVTGSLTSGGEVITSISSSTVTKLGSLSSSLSTSIGQLSSSMASSMTSLSSSLTSSMGSLSSSMASSMTTLSSSLTGSMGGLSSSMATSMNDLSSSMGSIMATTGSNLFKGNQTISGSIIPAVNGLYDLGSITNEFRDLYLSSASLYIDGTKVLGSTTQELTITTDTGQSFKILEAGSDTITLQAADGNITLATSGGGDVILDPTSGLIALKGTTTLYAGNKILSSDGNAIQIGNSVTMTGSLIVTGFIETQELRTTYISSSILYRSGSTKFGDELGDTHSFTGSLTVSGSISVPDSGLVSGSSQITYSGLTGVPSGIISGSSQLPSGLVSGSIQVLNGSGVFSGSAQLPSGLVSGSAQTIANLPSGVVSGSAQTIANLPSGTVSGSSQVLFTGTTGYSTYINQAVLTSSSPTFAGLTNNGTYTQTTTSTQPVYITGDSGDTSGIFRIQIDSVNDSFGTGARTFLGDGGIDIFLGTGNSSYTPVNTYIALNHSGEISMGAGSATKHFILSTSGAATFSSTISVGSRLALQPSYFGYSSSYKTLLIGGSGTDYTTNAVTLAFNVDITANPGGSFGGNGTEYIWRNAGSFKTPNAANTEYNTLLSWNSSGALTINQGATFSGLITGNAYFNATSSSGYRLRNSNDTASVGGFTRRGLWEGNANYDPGMWAETGYGLYFYTNGSAVSPVLTLATTGAATLSSSLTVAGATNHTGAVRMNNSSEGNSPKITFGTENESSAGNKSIYLETFWMILQPHVNEGLRVRFVNGSGTQTETVRLQSTQASFYTSISSTGTISASGNMSARNFSRSIKSWSPAGATGSYTTTTYNWANELAALASNFDDAGFYSGYIRSGNGAHFYGYYFKIVVGSKGYGGNDLQYKIQDLVGAHAPWAGGCGGTAFGTVDTVNFTHRNNPCGEALELFITKLGG